MNTFGFQPLSKVRAALQDNSITARDLALSASIDWMVNFIGKPNPDKGIGGPVCPRVPRALNIDSVHVTYLEVPDSSTDSIFESQLLGLDACYSALDPSEGPDEEFKAAIIVFGRQDADFCSMIDRVQRKLKLAYLTQGLMLGKFHQYLSSRGAHNPGFKPHNSPYPILAVRAMVEGDAGNLIWSTASNEHKIRYLEIYIEKLAFRGRGGKQLAWVQTTLESLKGK